MDADPDLYDSLDGQAALVTGATRGIGAAVAADLAARGATVYAGARDTDDVDAPDQRPVRLDVTEEADIAAATDRIADEAGRLDIVVNNVRKSGALPQPIRNLRFLRMRASSRGRGRSTRRRPRTWTGRWP